MHDDDQLKAALAVDKASGKFELDENGYTRFIPSKDEAKKIDAWLGEEIARALEDHQPVFQDAAENIETYKAVKGTIADSGETILPSPIARIPADQIIAWTYNTVLRPKPIFSLDAYFPADYDVAVPVQMPDPTPDPMTGQLSGREITVAVPTPTNAETVAMRLEQGVDFKMRERLGFSEFLRTIVTDCVTGASPAWAKVCRTLKTRPTMGPKVVKGAFLDLSTKTETYVRDGEEVHFYAIPTFNVLMPMDEDDPNESPWIAERTPLAPEEFRGRVLTEKYFLVDEEEGERLSKMTSDTRDAVQAGLVESTQNRVAATPRSKCDVWEVWFYRYIKFVDPETNKKTVKRISFMGDYHLTARRLVSCHRNPYDHQQRIHIPFWQIKDPHSHAGSSTVGILKYHQKVATHLIQAEIKNAFHANNFTYWYDEDSRVADFFAGKRQLSPGEFIPGKEGEDWGVTRVGAQHYSLLGMMQWIAAQAQQSSNVSSYEAGDNIPGRTPAATVAQILEQGRQQPIMFLRTLNDSLVKLVRLYLETVRQFQPMGETIPLRNPETREIVEVPFRFPVGEVLDNFRIALTAADEAMAKEHELEQLTMLKNLLMQDANFVAQVAGPMSNPQLTEGQVELFRKILDANGTLMKKIMSLSRTDEEVFDYSKAIGAIVEEHNQAQAAMQQQQAAMEGMNANQPANAAGNGAGPEGGPDAGGPAGVGAEPPLPPDPSGMEAQGLPPM